jgi:hypothetical protein
VIFGRPLSLWLALGAWTVVPLAHGGAVAGALHSWGEPTRSVASAGLWAAWLIALLALLVPVPAALTASRLLLAASVPLLTWAGWDGGPGWEPGLALLAATLLSRPEAGEWFVNGGAYPNERRYLLRTPGFLLLGPLPVLAAAAVAAPAVVLLLVADRRWPAAVVAAVLGLPAATVSLRSLHQLSRRWAVLVPAGLVVHDPLSLADPVLLPTKIMTSVGRAEAGTDALDLTQRSLGAAVEIEMDEKIPMGRRTGRRDIENGASARLMIAPTRWVELLTAAHGRGLPAR